MSAPAEGKAIRSPVPLVQTSGHIHPALAGRENTPAISRAWVQEREDARIQLEERFSQWTASISRDEDLFKRHVYENVDARDMDFRQHRQRLYLLLFRGEELAVDFIELGGDAVQNFVAIIDQKLDALRAVLHAWHGPLESQNDLPDSFRQGVKDITEGKVVDMEKALHDAPQ